uniref:Uncharacterized protein n=1 Tax=Cajanus cajan TaxID=3821 RepID=A0A151QZW8_CAJCA|nr:hypothetical protein KK1_043084 [Cajanus cajan]
MGNYVSCTLAPPLMKNAKATRVIIPTGEVKQFREIVKAAELMLEHPNYFLVNSRSLHIGRRFSPLAADEDLEFGNVYIFFPMRRVNSLVTPADMAVLFWQLTLPLSGYPAEIHVFCRTTAVTTEHARKNKVQEVKVVLRFRG